mmetsp:Transcript_10080/g.38170  ORF Transcript_10080/g.38170 Transcript_10080/m.38170 type:complete len:112 (+) Transcript_10080:376-711(+)|eukprot:scaffold149_cov315-Pinguiococcus_pyrenoidosus.AAC.14
MSASLAQLSRLTSSDCSSSDALDEFLSNISKAAGRKRRTAVRGTRPSSLTAGCSLFQALGSGPSLFRRKVRFDLYLAFLSLSDEGWLGTFSEDVPDLAWWRGIREVRCFGG